MKFFKSIVYLALIISSLFTVQNIHAQVYEDYQLRLEPVWSRVADALGEPGSVESAEFSPNGRYIISGAKYDNSVIMWRTSDGHELWRKYTTQEIERVGWSADNKYVAACSEDFLVTVYDAAGGEIVKTIKHNFGIDGLTWSNKGSWLASGEEKDKKEDEAFIRIFDMPSGEEIQRLDFGGTVNELFFSLDDRYLLAGGHGSLKVYNTEDWSLAGEFIPNKSVKFVTSVFSPDAQHLFAGDNKGNLYVIDWKQNKVLRHFIHTGKKIESVTWHPNGEYLAFVGHDPYIRVYRVKDVLAHRSERIPVAHKVWAGDHAEYMDFNADGSFLVSAHQNGLIKLWAWMGEDPALNDKRHSEVSKLQKSQ